MPSSTMMNVSSDHIRKLRRDSKNSFIAPYTGVADSDPVGFLTDPCFEKA